MKFSTVIIITAFLAIGVATADEWKEIKINHDEVQPFPQREPTTDMERVAILLKPQLFVENGCSPYPAVNDFGVSSGGLNPSGDPTGECEEPYFGSQIYGRAGDINGLYAIMYMWYFPKTLYDRHGFRALVVFFDRTNLKTPTIRGCSLSAPTDRGFTNYVPCPAENIKGHTIQVKYHQVDKDDHIVSLTELAGAFQPLIMWDQMTDFARTAMNATVFDDASVPLNDFHFELNLRAAWSITNVYDKAYL